MAKQITDIEEEIKSILKFWKHDIFDDDEGNSHYSEHLKMFPLADDFDELLESFGLRVRKIINLKAQDEFKEKIKRIKSEIKMLDTKILAGYNADNVINLREHRNEAQERIDKIMEEEE